jgi:hypothetical protein
MYPITVRKTLARFAFYVDQSRQGKSHEQIVKALDFTDEEFNSLIEKCIYISNCSDYDLNILCVDRNCNYPIGGTEIIESSGKTIAFL